MSVDAAKGNKTQSSPKLESCQHLFTRMCANFDGALESARRRCSGSTCVSVCLKVASKIATSAAMTAAAE